MNAASEGGKQPSPKYIEVVDNYYKPPSAWCNKSMGNMCCKNSFISTLILELTETTPIDTQHMVKKPNNHMVKSSLTSGAPRNDPRLGTAGHTSKDNIRKFSKIVSTPTPATQGGRVVPPNLVKNLRDPKLTHTCAAYTDKDRSKPKLHSDPWR